MDSLPRGSILVYDSPDRVLEVLRLREPVPVTASQLVERYQRLGGMARSHRLISCWCLSQLSLQELEDWALNPDGYDPTYFSDWLQFPPVERPPVAALTAAVLFSFLNDFPECVDVYIQLELISERFGAPPDANFLLRASQSLGATSMLDDWWQPFSDHHLLKLQLEQVEEELLTLFLANQRQRDLLAVQHLWLRRLFTDFRRLHGLLSRLVSS